MKIHEVSLKTGLTEKAIRLYIQNGLIHPHVEEGLHRNSYTFSEKDIKELEEISRLEVHELANTSQVANSLRPAIEKEDTVKESISKRPLYICIILILLFIFLLFVHSKGGIFAVVLISSFLYFLAGLISFVMTIRYGTATLRASKLPHKGKGTIVSVVEEHGFDIGFSAGRGSAGTKEPGIGGIWQIAFMLWNEIRPDCWYPVILYLSENGKKESATLRYGRFKNTLHIGDEIDIAWDEANPTFVSPLDKKYIAKKVLFYTLISLLSFTVCIILLITLT